LVHFKGIDELNVILPSEFELNLKLDKFEVIEGTPEDREFVELLKEKENLARTYKAVDLFGAKPVEEANYDSSKGEIDWSSTLTDLLVGQVGKNTELLQ